MGGVNPPQQQQLSQCEVLRHLILMKNKVSWYPQEFLEIFSQRGPARNADPRRIVFFRGLTPLNSNTFLKMTPARDPKQWVLGDLDDVTWTRVILAV